jgi:hypothetical protein
MSSRLVSEKLRNLCWRVLRTELILWTTWDSLSGFCSNAAARQSFLQFSESSLKREFIKTPSTIEFTNTGSIPQCNPGARVPIKIVFTSSRYEALTSAKIGVGCKEKQYACEKITSDPAKSSAPLLRTRLRSRFGDEHPSLRQAHDADVRATKSLRRHYAVC